MPLVVKQGHWQVSLAAKRRFLPSLHAKGLKRKCSPWENYLMIVLTRHRDRLQGHSSAAFSRPLAAWAFSATPQSLPTLRINVSGCSQHPAFLPVPKRGLCRPSVPTLPLCLWSSTHHQVRAGCFELSWIPHYRLMALSVDLETMWLPLDCHYLCRCLRFNNLKGKKTNFALQG